MKPLERLRSRAAAGVIASLAFLAGSAIGAPPTCPGDIDENGIIEFVDLLAVLEAWGPCPDCPEDVNGSGVVDFQDLVILLSVWGPCPGEVFSLELVGNPLSAYPHFEFVRVVNEGSIASIAVDPGSIGDGVLSGDVFIVTAKTEAEWGADTTLTDVRGGPQFLSFNGATIEANTHALVASDTLSGDAGLGLGVGYDVVIDANRDGRLDGGDFIDGRGDAAGFSVVHDVTAEGPLAVTELTYSVPNWSGAPGFAPQNLFYPTDIASMGELPLVIMSHGNGHDYQWYDHLGRHLASYGYILMSHANNTVPGVLSASTTTLLHADAFLRELPSIAGGALAGHVDASRMTWIGHSRGGEGVVIAYDRIFDGEYVPERYTLDDIRLISSIAPTDFEEGPRTDPHAVPYHLWTAAGDADVSGCASCNLCQTFHLHDRAQQFRQSISLYGAGHGDFHNGGGSSVFSGPCPIGRPNTHAIMRGYVLPLVKHYIEGNAPARDFLTRQWESFRPIGAPETSCVVVDLMYRAGEADRFVIDDYQTQASTGTSSSGGGVAFSVGDVDEGRADDSDTSFTTSSGTMNGMTLGGPADETRVVVFQWNADAFYELEIVPGARDLSDDEALMFRACQETRAADTIAELGDLTFTVSLRDGAGVTSRIDIGAYGGGIEEPYQRSGCGMGVGWANEFESIRIRLRDFLHNGSGLDLADVVAVRFDFGPSFGSARGRIGLDDVEITRN